METKHYTLERRYNSKIPKTNPTRDRGGMLHEMPCRAESAEAFFGLPMEPNGLKRDVSTGSPCAIQIDQ
jgi:hypothetical protein